MSYICPTNVAYMKKNEPGKKPRLYGHKNRSNMVQEPAPVYKTVRALPQVKDFTYNEFKKIADKTPFTQAEWATMLHVSERTLQRYAKGNGHFAPINAERALQIAHVVAEGKKTFGKVEM